MSGGDIRRPITGIATRQSASGLAGLDFAFRFAIAIRQIGHSFAIDGGKDAFLSFARADGFVAVKRVFYDDHVTPFALNARAFVTTGVSAHASFFQFLQVVDVTLSVP